jgi:hypothetical protein
MSDDDEKWNLIDPEWDDSTFNATLGLPERPKDWKDEPMWNTWGDEIRLRSFSPSGFHSYVRGHVMCAEASLHRLLAQSDDAGNYMALPMLGILRHTVEIAMKDLLLAGIELEYDTGQVTRRNVFDTHDLDLLARSVETMLVSQGGRGEKLAKGWIKLRPYLQWWQEHDPKNALGRYPFDKQGSLLGEGRTIDITNPLHIARATLSLWHFTYPWLDAMQEYAHEARSDEAAEHAAEQAAFAAEMRAEAEAEARQYAEY